MWTVETVSHVDAGAWTGISNSCTFRGGVKKGKEMWSGV